MGLMNVWPLKSRSKDRFFVQGSFRPASAGTETIPYVTNGSIKGDGFTVARTSAGLFTITFDKKVGQLDSIAGFARSQAAITTPTLVEGKVNALTNGIQTAQLRVWRGATSTGTLAGLTVASDISGLTCTPSIAGLTASTALTLGKGFIPIDLGSIRELSAGAIQNLAAHGGILAVDSTPVLGHITAAKEVGLAWAAGNTDTLCIPGIPLPPDFDESVAASVHMVGYCADANVMTVAAFFGTNGTDAGGNTLALAAGRAEVFKALTQANQEAHPGSVTITITPGAHGAATCYINSIWIEYTRKGWSAATTPGGAVTAAMGGAITNTPAGSITTDAHKFASADQAANADYEVCFIASFKPKY